MNGQSVGRILVFVCVLVFVTTAAAMNGRTTYQAKIVKPDGYPLQSTSVNFRFTVLDTVGSCILYVEDYAAINMQNTGGLISFALGNGAISFPSSATTQTFQSIFDNSTPSMACQNAGVYLPGPNDVRRVVMQFNDGSGWQTLPAMTINTVPYAMYANSANNAKTLNNKADTAFVEYTTLSGLNCNASEALRFNGGSFSCVPAATSAAAIVAALGYTPLSSADMAATVASGTVLTTTINNLSSSATIMSSAIDGLATSMGAITSSQWTTAGSNIYYSGNGVGIGTSSPAELLHLVGPSQGYTTNGLKIDTYSDTTATQVWLGSARGSVSSPMAVTTNSRLALIAARGFGQSQFSGNTAAIEFKAAENFTDTAWGSRIVFATTPNSSTARSERMRIENDGNIGIGTIAPVTRLDVAGGVRISMEASACAVSFAGTLRYNAGAVEFCNGTSWTAFGLSGAGLQSINGSTSGTQSFAHGFTGTTPNIVTTNGVHTLNIPLASAGSVTAGLISNSDYLTFNNKMNNTSAAVVSALGYTPASASALSSYVLRTNNLSDLTSITTARANLGLGTFATANSIDLGSASATGIIADSRLANQAGVISGTQYTKVTVDGKGRVVIGAQLAMSDVTAALGYTPAQATSATQWTTSGATINYMSGNVGIGTTTPSTLNGWGRVLDVHGVSHSKIVATNATDGVSVTTGVYSHSLVPNGYGGYPQNYGGVGLVGTETGHDFGIMTGNVTRISVTSGGAVGIGTTTPAAKLDVQGQVKTSMGSPLVNPAGNAVDFATGNTQYVTFSTCPGNTLTANLFSMFEGSSYSLVVVAPNGCIVEFTGTTHAYGGSGGTAVTAFKYPAGQKFSSTGNPMVYSFLRANNFVFVAQVVDFQ